MKILLIMDNDAPTGGAEKYFFDLKTKLEELPGIHVYTIGFGDGYKQSGHDTIFPRLKSKASKLFWGVMFHPKLFLQLRKLIATIQPDVIHLHNVKQYSTTVLRAIAPYPVVHTMHDFSFICPSAQNIHRDLTPCETGLRLKCFWQHRIKFSHAIYLALTFSFYILRRHIKKTVDHFISPSPYLAHYLQKNNFTPVSCVLPFLQTPMPKINVTHDKIFLFVGQLNTHKGVLLLLDEFARAYQQDKTIRLQIAGSGPLCEMVKAKIKLLKIDRACELLGWQEDLTPYYNQATAVIFPSIGMESFGLVMTEAMSFARPVIGINRGTCAWLIADKKTGLLFDPLKPGDLADKILLLAQDNTLAERLGLAALNHLQTLQNQYQPLNEIVNLYRDLSKA